MRKTVRRGFIFLAALMVVGFAVRSASAFNTCGVVESCFEIEISVPGGEMGGGTWRCEGVSPVPALTPVGEDVCYLITYYIDCSGNVVRREPIDIQQVPCGAAGTFRYYCTPASMFFGDRGHCELVDYYGNSIRLRVCAPPHEFEARPYPVGFVAREDIFGVFHPTFRIRWIPPALGNPNGDFPTYADSGWRLWTWGGRNQRGPGNPPVFPCDLDEEALLNREIPAGTTCIRMQLWSAPTFLGGRTPALAPGVLQYPTRGINLSLPPDRVVALNFPYASHPGTGQVVTITVGDAVLPVFPGFFQRWWYVRLRLEERWVKDIPGEREVCEPVPDANGDGHPDRGGDCRVILGDPPVEWPGEKKIERYVKAKEWENREVDGILNLTALGYLYDGLHPPSGLAYTPDGRVRIPLIMRNGQPWLWIPIAVREGQGVVCANPGCVGSEFELP